VANELTREWLLHRGRCWHLGGFTDGEADELKKPKICSDSRERIEAEVRKEGKELRECAHCHKEKGQAK
jgi:hypothetical protein